MGNEMGNNNVSGLQEDEKARTEEDQGKFLQEDYNADELKGENDTKLEAEEKDLPEKRKINENGEDTIYQIGEATDLHEVLAPSETPLADLANKKHQEENEISNGKEEHDTQFKPLFGAAEIPPDSNDADLRSEEQEFVSSEIVDFSEKTNLDDNFLTTAEHGSKKEMPIGGENQTVDSKAGSGEMDPNSDQQEVVQDEQVAECISIPLSENGHLVSNEVAKNMNLCVKQETGDHNVATMMGTLLVKVKADEDESETLSCPDKFDVFSPEEVDSKNEHNVVQSPLNALQTPQKAHESALEASYQQQEALNSPLEKLEAPMDTLNSPLETLEPSVEASESPKESSQPQPLALALLIKASDSPLEESEALLDALNPNIETLEPPLEASDPQPLALDLLVKPSDPSQEASNSPLEASEPAIGPSEPTSEDSEPMVEASNSRPEPQLEASELALEASDPPLELSESQLETFSQASPINYPQEVYEPHDKAIYITEAINGETKLANNQAQSSEENGQKFEILESKTSQYEQMCDDSDCYENDRKYALASDVENDYIVIDSDMNSGRPQVAISEQTLNPCLEEEPALEESMLLTKENIPIGSEVESEENQGGHINTLIGDQELKDFKTDYFIASQLMCLDTETDSKKSAEQSAHEVDFTNGIGEICQVEDLEAKCKEYQVALVDKSLKLESSDEVADTMSEIKAVSTESNVTDYKNDEYKSREETGDKEKESLLESDRDSGDIIEKSMSPNSSNDFQDVPPDFLYSKALKDRNELITDLKSEVFIITESFQAIHSVAVEQSMMETPEQKAEQNIQETSVVAETSSLLFDEKSAKGQETVEKLMTEPSSDSASNHVEFRKSPSFHFDLSNEPKCEESDQTPLLCNDSTAGRRDEAMIQKCNVQIDYNAPQDDEAVLVEEKTIRMERSDSERPSAPFLSFLQKEESAEILVAPEKQEKNVADKKTKKDPWTVIHKTFALTSPRDSNGKRKAKSSIFSSICCATKTP